MKRFQPFWFDEAIDSADLDLAKSLEHDIDTDACIVGGGFTGLWTAIMLKQARPALDVTVIDKGLCGQGASGRNGGAMLTWSTKFASLIKQFGLEQARFFVQNSEQAVHEIHQFTQRYGIDCDCRVDGTYYTASNQAQVVKLAPVLELLEKHRLNHWQLVDGHKLQATGSNANKRAIFSPHAGSIQPAKLVRGLRRIAIKLGVRIFEHTAYQSHGGGETLVISTQQGHTIRATSLTFAVNAWLPSLLSEFARSVVLVSSDMVITKPIPALLSKRNLRHGAPIIDARIFVNYYRTTPDGRLMLGKGGNYFSFANQVSRRFDQASRYSEMLEHSVKYFFGKALPIERTWTGPSDRSVSGMPFFGQLTGQDNVFYGSGYSGNGVVQSYLGGKILSALIMKQNNAWSRCALVNGQLSKFPFEPFRSVGAYTIRNAIRRKERAQDMGKVPSKLDIWLSGLSGSAAKLDPDVKGFG
ncbi:FAD-dependent oxidoreductase [Pseudoalteromonas sp. SMS1]|uniref:FAD-dependent oxidoreductase n=1 Tax=Pseudoalteromonas sp. SMS1 TaxID=2908894 RepID=UPI001F24C36A|nr:FAD-dependent oxidoreductase [Pseudoalteromonas sp. SMS1]MCF2859980.1 FAD-dependent oxidoreductase [Pseudoalteromonas sp. SMS1]